MMDFKLPGIGGCMEFPWGYLYFSASYREIVNISESKNDKITK
jgi:hypothetical protein